ncbi:biotin/lipoyl-containing protein, partial [Streptomyces sp. NPDC051907]|uniref:biotin/lipoyl-containing protein n=1 Tax=Streptomyces sp. NPDC051907 TaxID=3155284 RepID=UPI00341723EE
RTGAARAPGRVGAWRNLTSQPQAKTYEGRAEHEVRYRATRDGYAVDGMPGLRVAAVAPGRATLEADGVVRHFDVAAYGDGTVHVDSAAGGHALVERPRFPDPAARHEPGSLLAPMPGTVVRVGDGLAEGVRVAQGQPLVWLEAMKMEHRILAPASGVLTALHAAPGRQVEVGALLAVVQEAPEAPEAQKAPDAPDAQEEREA